MNIPYLPIIFRFSLLLIGMAMIGGAFLNYFGRLPEHQIFTIFSYPYVGAIGCVLVFFGITSIGKLYESSKSLLDDAAPGLSEKKQSTFSSWFSNDGSDNNSGSGFGGGGD